jgi:hypothetical protein
VNHERSRERLLIRLRPFMYGVMRHGIAPTSVQDLSIQCAGSIDPVPFPKETECDEESREAMEVKDDDRTGCDL